MSGYNQLLEATIQHLQMLRSQGVRLVPASPEALKALASTPRFGRVKKSEGAPQPLGNSQPAAKRSMGANHNPPSNSSTPAPAETITNLPTEKVAALEELRARALVCQKCAHLASSRKNVVFGVGNIEADIMFVGEAPGADEDEQGEPFVGAAGKLLTRIIETMGLSRQQVYIANILKCRPDTPGQKFGNRPPTPQEMERCLPYLHAQIDLIKPKVLVALGATAVTGLFGEAGGITKIRGNWREYRSIPVMPTYHPSYLLRPNPNNIKRQAWEDMLQVMERVGLPISEKQRGYFLTKQS